MAKTEMVYITVENEQKDKKAMFAIEVSDEEMKVSLKFEPEVKVKENPLYANIAMEVLDAFK